MKYGFGRLSKLPELGKLRVTVRSQGHQCGNTGGLDTALARHFGRLLHRFAGFFAHKERTFVMKVRVFWSFCHILQFLTNYRISYNYLTSMSNGVNKGRKIFQGCFSGQLACFFKKIQWIEKELFSRLLVHTFFHVCEYIVGEIFLRGDCVVQKRVDV